MHCQYITNALSDCQLGPHLRGLVCLSGTFGRDTLNASLDAALNFFYSRSGNTLAMYWTMYSQYITYNIGISNWVAIIWCKPTLTAESLPKEHERLMISLDNALAMHLLCIHKTLYSHQKQRAGVRPDVAAGHCTMLG